MYLSERSVPYSLQWYPAVKRFLDVLVCLACLPVVLVLLILIAAAIKLDSPGRAFFVQPRVGLAGRPFRLYKFRTLQEDYDDAEGRAFMASFVRGATLPRPGAEAAGEDETRRVYKPIKDRDVTRVGRILRRTSLDEMPQILNVLRGEMSLVGPRPNVPWEVDVYRSWHLERLTVQPGITGLAQVHGRSGISFDQIANYDIEYARNRSLTLDLQILWQTAASVLSANGAG